MKQVLIFHSNQQSIADLQSQLAGQCYIYATTHRAMALEFLQHNPVECLIIHLPSEWDQYMKRESEKLLKSLQRRNGETLTKIIVCSKSEEQQVRDFLELGVTAIVGDALALQRVVGG